MTEPVFQKLPQQMDFPREEREVLALWKERRVFERSLDLDAPKGSFVFYEGPPTANGTPHNGHVLTRVIKDLFPRFRTMCGYRVPRKAGWDTHGLPVEVEVEKELRIHGKAAIESYGVEPFVRRCIESVFRYTDEWEKLTERVGFWVDLDEAYVTYHKSYVESVWWALSELFKKGLLYQGHKVVWWWAQGGTALSSGEVGLGYKTVDDPSAYVAFPLVGDPETALLVWTTTPWTLPSNAYAAVHPDVDYANVESQRGKFIVAKELAKALEKALGGECTLGEIKKGRDLVGLEYTPPFDLYERELGRKDVPYWRVIPADFVTLDAGTGIVHVAPAFGEDDFGAHKKHLEALDENARSKVPLICAVKPDGTFVDELEPYAGRWVKSCDKDIMAELRQKGSLVHAETYRHDYPFCWRADDDALIQYARPAWYIRTTSKIQDAIANNQAINWLPAHIRDGRFGDFLANNVDWALSRERYWGTPLNVWVNDETGKICAPASANEILAKNPHAFDHFKKAREEDPSLSEHLMVHKPWIDAVTWQEPSEPGTYRRVPDVIDCWFDSGCMPFAQWGFPHTGDTRFYESFPADFISEAIDQTRGWFYTLLMVSTLVFDEECQSRMGIAPRREFPHPYRNCIVLGHVSDREGKKESKSKGNYTPPDVILDVVKMDFAVVRPEDVNVTAKVGEVAIAREDLDGLDLKEGATVRVTGPGGAIEAAINVGKKMRRRIVALSDDDRRKLGVELCSKQDVSPVEVPRLDAHERVSVEDVASPAPGADAFRWFFYASNPPWNATRHSLSNVRALQKETLIKLRNVHSFFTIYANIDGFDPFDGESHAEEPSELDRYALSIVTRAVRSVRAELEAYDPYAATRAIVDVVERLSNWYVRRCRGRFWRSGWDPDKRAAFSTLYRCLVELSALMAPFTPFLAERMYQHLVVDAAKRQGRDVPDSVHLCTFPTGLVEDVDDALVEEMTRVQSLVSLGLQVRTESKIKVRQPLRVAHVIVAAAKQAESVERYSAMIKDELNVLDVDVVEAARTSEFVSYRLKPNFRSLGGRGLGKEAQRLKSSMVKLSPADAQALVLALAEGSVEFDGVTLEQDDLDVAFETKDGFKAAGGRAGVVVLETDLDDELKELGFLRELQNRVQTARKEMGLDYTDRIRLGVQGGVTCKRVLEQHGTSLCGDVLAVGIESDVPEAAYRTTVDVEGESVTIAVSRAPQA